MLEVDELVKTFHLKTFTLTWILHW